MKKTIVQIAICLFCFGINSYAQKEMIIFEKTLDNNYLYQNFPISFAIKNEENSCETFYLTSNNGTIKRDKCHYIITPSKLHQTEIAIFKIVKNDTTLFEKRRFYVKETPLPTAEVASKHGGKIGKVELQVQMGVAARLKYFSGDAKYNVTKYRILLMRDEKLIGTHLNIGSKFDDEVIDLLRKIKPKDKVYFVDIYTKYIDGEEVKLNVIEFEIVE